MNSHSRSPSIHASNHSSRPSMTSLSPPHLPCTVSGSFSLLAAVVPSMSKPSSRRALSNESASYMVCARTGACDINDGTVRLSLRSRSGRSCKVNSRFLPSQCFAHSCKQLTHPGVDSPIVSSREKCLRNLLHEWPVVMYNIEHMRKVPFRLGR